MRALSFLSERFFSKLRIACDSSITTRGCVSGLGVSRLIRSSYGARAGVDRWLLIAGNLLVGWLGRMLSFFFRFDLDLMLVIFALNTYV